MGKAMGLKLTGMFKSYEDYPLGEAKKAGFRKMTVTQSKIKGKKLSIDFSPPSSVSHGSKKN